MRWWSLEFLGGGRAFSSRAARLLPTDLVLIDRLFGRHLVFGLLAGGSGKESFRKRWRSWEVMKILAAYDLIGSLRGAMGLAGCDRETGRALGPSA